MDDTALVRGTLAGRREDFDALVERYQKTLYAFVYRWVHDHTEAAEIVQMTFVQAYTHLGQFGGRSTFKTWLHQIALNQVRAARRGRRQHEFVPLEAVSESRLNEARLAAAGGGSAAVSDGAAGASGWRPVLERLIALLPFRQRSVLTLRIFSDLRFKDIAQVMGITENSAKVNYHHAVMRLRQRIREEDP